MRKTYDVRDVIARLVDGSEFDESALYGETLVTGFARIWGYPVGIVANNGILFFRKRAEGAHSSRCARCAASLIFLQTSRLQGRQEIRGGGIAKDGAKMGTAVPAPLCRSSR